MRNKGPLYRMQGQDASPLIGYCAGAAVPRMTAVIGAGHGKTARSAPQRHHRSRARRRARSRRPRAAVSPKAERRWCNCATRRARRGRWLRRRAAIKAALAPFACPVRRQRSDRRCARRASRRRAYRAGRHDAEGCAARCSAPTRSSASRSRASTAAEAAPVGMIDYAGVGGVYATLSKEQKNRADRHRRGFRASPAPCAAARRICRSSGSPASMPRTRRR